MDKVAQIFSQENVFWGRRMKRWLKRVMTLALSWRIGLVAAKKMGNSGKIR